MAGLAAHQVAAKHGDFYAPRLCRALSAATDLGVVRVSLVHTNTLDEVDRIIAALDAPLG